MCLHDFTTAGDALTLERVSPATVVLNPPEKLVLEVEASGAYSTIRWDRNGEEFSTTEGAGFQVQQPEEFPNFYEIFVRDPTTADDLGIYDVEVLIGGIFQAEPDDIVFTVLPYGEW